jgi:hypothetical protein
MLFNIYLRKGAHGGQKSRGKWWWQKINLIDLKNNGFCRKESWFRKWWWCGQRRPDGGWPDMG